MIDDLAARIGRRLRGDVVERQGQRLAGGTDRTTLIRYFLCRGLGPRAMTPLAISPPMASLPRRVVLPPRLAKLLATALRAASGLTVALSPIAARADEEDLPAFGVAANDESDGEHGRAARKVGHPAAVMRNLLAITAA